MSSCMGGLVCVPCNSVVAVLAAACEAVLLLQEESVLVSPLHSFCACFPGCFDDLR